MPDRLPSLIVLAGFWVPPTVAGWVAGGSLPKGGTADRGRLNLAFAAFGVAYAAAWFLYNLGRMPPYIPGATMDPTIASPRAVRWLAAVTIGLILPLSILACAHAFRRRSRMLRDTSTPHARA